MFKKKSLGQNFLKNKGVVAKILDAGEICGKDIILEIGPGEGFMTEELLKVAKKVIAIEKDDRLIPILQQKFSSEIYSGKFLLIHDDVLSYEISDFKLQANSYKLIANIPYYITGEILRKFLESEIQPYLMVLMLQKEVAERIVSRDGKESILSMSVKAYGNPKFVDTVKAGSFSPAPSVDSAILKVENISKTFFEKFSEEKFFEIMKLGFGQKRKMLLGNLKKKFTEEKLKSAFLKAKIDEKARAETITLKQWKILIENL